MKKNNRRTRGRQNRDQNRKRLWIVLAAILLILGIVIVVSIRKHDDVNQVIEDLKNYQGYTRVVKQEEYEFYKYFVERNIGTEISSEEMDEKVKAYINEVNAVFYLGNQYGLCEPYSFELLKLRMEQENESRKVKQKEEEVVYGLTEFTLETYFQYVYTNLETDIQDYLADNSGGQMIQDAKNWYEEGMKDSQIVESITYQVTQDGVTEKLVVDQTQLKFLGKADMGLADFLSAAKVNDRYEDDQTGSYREVVVLDIQYTKEDFEGNELAVIVDYIRQKVYPMVIEQVKEQNPVEFQLDS